MRTIEEAKKFLRRNFEKGVDCPCCGQLVKLYRRKLNSGMAVCLLKILRAESEGHTDENGYVHVSTVLPQVYGFNGTNTEYSKLAKGWGLIERRGDAGEKTRSSGYWRTTESGKLFARGKLRVFSHAYMFDQRCRGQDGDMITIRDALGSKFDYAELMAGI